MSARKRRLSRVLVFKASVACQNPDTWGHTSVEILSNLSLVRVRIVSICIPVTDFINFGTGFRFFFFFFFF